MNTNNAVISKNVKHDVPGKKPIHSVTPFSLLDYPDKTSCILWFAGCNMKCSYCYNPEIVFGKGVLSFSEIFPFLNRRKKLLDAVVLSGGECLIHKDIIPVIRAIKEMGFLVKVDTNGSRPTVLELLLEENLIDYVALDFKGPKSKFQNITGLDAYGAFLKCFALLNSENIPFEIRTTFHSSLLTKEDITLMYEQLRALNYQKPFYIQNFRNYQNTIGALPEAVPLQKTDLSPDMTKIIFR